MPMPITTPPRIWLRAVFGLMIRPAATAMTTRVMRTTPSSSSTRASANTALCVLRDFCIWLSLRRQARARSRFRLELALAARTQRVVKRHGTRRLVAHDHARHRETRRASIARVAERLAVDAPRRLEQLLAERAAGELHRRAGRRSGPGAALDRRLGQAAVAELGRDRVDRKAERVGAQPASSPYRCRCRCRTWRSPPRDARWREQLARAPPSSGTWRPTCRWPRPSRSARGRPSSSAARRCAWPSRSARRPAA